jgi:hypothetical protein
MGSPTERQKTTSNKMATTTTGTVQSKNLNGVSKNMGNLWLGDLGALCHMTLSP